ncbi:hypothetical protein OIU74_026148 [Salix koriyanagi]|uniref:Uncharacterized protein n=1 Tax=Salix koriyanagi TaxID=2511006 RepID=A0A9Q0W2V4_9ROSI|nr:hypothetical protein OIU74_026148 [Salix koriyanagi]
MPARLAGVLGLLLRGVGLAFICRARAKVLAAPVRPLAWGSSPAAVPPRYARNAEARADVPGAKGHGWGSRGGL